MISVAAAAFFLSSAAAAPQAACPPRDKDGHIVFGDGAILMSTPLAVNPDGAIASYTPGDHGYTYLNNGVNLIGAGGSKIPCSAKANEAQCREKWLLVEKGAFGVGTPEFCVFAIEPEPLAAGKELVACEEEEGKGRFIVGNGKGQPMAGQSIMNVSGVPVTAYLSTTNLHHTRNGKVVYVDSAAIPGLVVPRDRPDLVGALAWVRYGHNESFAIVSDTGPAFGEGSVALHEMLQRGAIGPLQPVGPIPVAMRCTTIETGLKAPFTPKPDLGDKDRCTAGHHAQSPADIRAYDDIKSGVTSIILAKIKPPMHGHVVKEELTPTRLRDWAVAKGFTPEKLNSMAACLSH